MKLTKELRVFSTTTVMYNCSQVSEKNQTSNIVKIYRLYKVEEWVH